ncbi:MAG: glycosyltransferase family 2 protein [Candidatus Thiodiazotropha sp. (ex Lucinoma borealis)]|nr:glycosyltransferase family 2 protein [Candidatus Thiodiazotropha sp. (ex Troendleina suluensis)]MCU7866543.1 glycosyltransferase family 2 protein [Candidatus Thiodiazotropha sp. (ex Lucinoma borealis)]MCU7946753.1 glycosyltransferase family 2 protein [Candidatus Thiodiazotropha sp. (ex Cardiolucina cf. quadrata)]
MKLSVVSTLYYSSAFIEEFYRRTTQTSKKFAGDDYEIILVNDGSPDDSLDKVVQLVEKDDHLSIVDLSRNFGHHKAIMAGLEYSKGKFVYLIDSDLEEDPEWLVTFYEQMSDSDSDVVYGTQIKRKGGWFERWSGWLFYRLFTILTGVTIPSNWVTARLMTRRYVEALLLHNERELSIGGLFLLTGFKQQPVSVTKHGISGTTYTFSKKIAVLVNAVTSLSSRPLVGIFYSGALIFITASFYSMYMIINWVFLSSPPSGWTSVIISIWLLGGLTISFIGIIGIYLSKIFLETKQRPSTIVRHVYGKKKD